MQEVRSNLYPCRHCEETGVCRAGPNGSSCLACAKYHELKGKEFVGLACGTCGGLGQSEPVTERMNKRVKPLLAMLIVFLLLLSVFILALINNPYFPEFLAFASTLIGGVTAFYFNNRSNS
ncbi:MAG TPA: molecular chaperone DnaJ [Spongiibacteraceae bacterium]|nr:molecular chaperone DnaJ [Spongiibacteraceae bacterium]